MLGSLPGRSFGLVGGINRTFGLIEHLLHLRQSFFCDPFASYVLHRLSFSAFPGPIDAGSERVDVGLQAIRVHLDLLLDDVLPSLDRGLDAILDVGRGDDDESASPGVQ
jgi:hypothetical protein